MPDPESRPHSHEGPVRVGEARNHQAPAGLGLLEARFVRYPGSQQLTLWLPRPGQLGYGELRVLGPAGRIVEQAPVRERLNGSVQILCDTLAWPEGDYRIEIEHADGWRHELALHKLAPDAGSRSAAASPAPEPTPAAAPASPRDPDGGGQPIPDEDLLLRQRLFQELQRNFARRVEYEGNVRAGTLTYVDGDRRIVFAHEMAAGGVKFVVDVPCAENWLSATGVALQQREEILRVVAESVQRDRGAERFEIGATEIRFY